MDAERWDRVQGLFHEAADLPRHEQRAFLESRCGDDAALLTEVLELLEEDARGATLLDRGVARAAYDMLGGDSPRPLPTEPFGSYRITRVLGEGGMGVVYLAERDDLKSLAAVKILRDAWLSPLRRERFASEQRTLAQLNHPSIARLYDANTLSDGTPWFVMEFVEGLPLTEYCRSRASTIPERLRLLREVAEAVQYAHSLLVIHRDLKPSNILVRHDGTVKLLDFGISKQLDSLDAAVEQTRTAMRLMTPAYAAPEQIRGGRVGVHTDVYSLGVILYELLVGRLPFDLSNRTPGEAEAMIVERDVERPSAAAHRMPFVSPGSSHVRSVGKNAWTDLDVLCLTAMHKDPQRRYRTVEALIRDLDHFLAGEPLEARADTVRYRAGKFLRRNWQQVSAAAAVFVSVVALTVFYTVRLTTARNAAVAEAARTQRIQGFMMNLFRGGDESVGPGDSLRVVTLVDRGVQEARRLDNEPAVQAELYETLGSIYRQLGNLPRADTLLRTSLDQRRRLFGPAHADVASSLIALGRLRDAQANYDEAEQFARAALAMSARPAGSADRNLARATQLLGRTLEDRGSYDKATPVLEEAVRLAAVEGEKSPDYRASMSELANTQFYAGHFATSDSLNRRILAMDREAYGNRHPDVADDLINLGAIQFEWGHLPDAERYYQDALVILRNYYGENHPETASALTMLARAYVSDKRFDEAVPLLKEAVTVYEKFYGPSHPRVANALNELGRTAQKQGHLDEAEADFRRMVDIYKQVYHDHHYLIGIALSNLAGVYYDRKNYAESDRIFREVLQRYRGVLEPDHMLVGIAHIRLGKTLAAERRWRDAEQESLTGLQIVSKQQSSSISWLATARETLVSAYDSLHQPEQAAKFRAQLVAKK